MDNVWSERGSAWGMLMICPAFWARRQRGEGLLEQLDLQVVWGIDQPN